MKAQDGAQSKIPAGTECGYSLLEMAFVVLIMGIVMTIAAPSTKTALQGYHLNAAVKDVSGAIQSTRYLAVMKGYTHNIAFDQNTSNYQLGVKIPPATTFSNSGNPIPWSVSNDITLSPSTTLQFSPGGTVTATTGTLSFTMSNATTVETVTVSSVGDVIVSP
jgi:prepilin-type N-terminal cleavage/methylation domain-containing protein